MHKVSTDLSVAIAEAARRYALTPAEVRVLRAVIEVGGGVRDGKAVSATKMRKAIDL